MAQANRRQFTILAEGKRDYDFVRAFLKRRYGRDRVECRRAQTLAAGQGAGEQQVRARYPRELQALRTYSGKNRYLVVVTDGDRLSPAQRRQTLEDQAARQSTDNALIIVPCRNLETWFAWLDGTFVDEETDHKSQYRHAKPTSYGTRMAQRCQNAQLAQWPLSLQDACQELVRLP